MLLDKQSFCPLYLKHLHLCIDISLFVFPISLSLSLSYLPQPVFYLIKFCILSAIISVFENSYFYCNWNFFTYYPWNINIISALFSVFSPLETPARHTLPLPILSPFISLSSYFLVSAVLWLDASDLSYLLFSPYSCV